MAASNVSNMKMVLPTKKLVQHPSNKLVSSRRMGSFIKKSKVSWSLTLHQPVCPVHPLASIPRSIIPAHLSKFEFPNLPTIGLRTLKSVPKKVARLAPILMLQSSLFLQSFTKHKDLDRLKAIRNQNPGIIQAPKLDTNNNPPLPTNHGS